MEYLLVSLLSLLLGYMFSVFGHRKLWAKYADARVHLHVLRHRVNAIVKAYPRAAYMETEACPGPDCKLTYDIEL